MICPNCQVDVAITEQLFGALYTCQTCRAMYFINFEGQPEFGDVALASSDSRADLTEPLNDNEGGNGSEFESSLEPLIDSIDVVSFDHKLDEQFAELEIKNEPSSEVAPIREENSLFDEIAQEISDFGNTEVQLANLNYDLIITGLDTQEIQRLFKEAIEDTKFAWDVAEIMRSIKNGQIQFEKMNPVKAYILAKRLQFLDIEKQWKQNAMS